MRALVDTNIFLDVLLAREGLTNESQRVLDWLEENPAGLMDIFPSVSANATASNPA
jgi:hypothetical protein